MNAPYHAVDSPDLGRREYQRAKLLPYKKILGIHGEHPFLRLINEAGRRLRAVNGIEACGSGDGEDEVRLQCPFR